MRWWCEISDSIVIATGAFEIGAMFALDCACDVRLYASSSADETQLKISSACGV
jgi:hypothetical protein